MDQFGIGGAVVGAAEVYFRASRGTGRTTSLVESVKDGDRVVFLNARDVREFERLIKDRRVPVRCTIVSPSDPHAIFERGGQPKGRTIFDHRWLEEFYLVGLRRIVAEVDRIERETSGATEVHRETRRAARVASLWNNP